MIVQEDFKRYIVNFVGWKAKERIIVIESDDWGSIRMPSNYTLQTLIKKNYPLRSCEYSMNDSIEMNQDVMQLFDLLSSHSNSFGQSPKFTLNNIVANPDFKKIKELGFSEYYYQPFQETLKSYPHSDKVMDIYKDGLDNNLIQMQFHGREHVNVNRWLEALQNREKRVHDAFELELFSIPLNSGSRGRDAFLDSFGRGYKNEIESEKSIINQGLDLFEKIWDFKSESFISPCYTWHSDIEKHLVDRGVKYLQSSRVQRIPISGESLKIRKKYHWTGKKNKSGLISMVRNVTFEPASQNYSDQVVDSAYSGIMEAFKLKKPAVISTHRVNYIGRLNRENREKSLKMLNKLLKRIIRNFPDVIFKSSDELGQLISNYE